MGLRQLSPQAQQPGPRYEAGHEAEVVSEFDRLGQGHGRDGLGRAGDVLHALAVRVKPSCVCVCVEVGGGVCVCMCAIAWGVPGSSTRLPSA